MNELYYVCCFNNKMGCVISQHEVLYVSLID